MSLIHAEVKSVDRHRREERDDHGAESHLFHTGLCQKDQKKKVLSVEMLG